MRYPCVYFGSKYLQANLRGFNGEDNIVKEETYHFLHRGNEEEIKYHMGWGGSTTESDSEVERFSTHTGSGGTYTCYTVLLYELQIGFVIMTNIDGALQEEGVRKMKAFLLSHVKAELSKNKVKI